MGRFPDLFSTLLLVLATRCNIRETYAAQDLTLKPLNQPRELETRESERAWTGDKARLRRHVEIEQRMVVAEPRAVRKMSTDPTQKFWPEFWEFGLEGEEAFQIDNTTIHTSLPFTPPLLAHSDLSHADSWNVLGGLFGRQTTGYQCSPGYSSCSGVGYVNSCCASGYTCTLVPNNSTGPVGCCLAGENCIGTVSSCNTAAGYSTCSNSGWGCCQPGAICDGTGCVIGGTTTVTGSTAVTVFSGASTPSLSTTTTTLSSSQTSTVQTVTETVVIVQSPTLSRTTVLVTSYMPTSTTYGGGSTSTTTITTTEITTEIQTTSTNAMVDSTTTTTTIAGSTITTGAQGYCPGGFYQCSAWYDGGCCRVGLNCAKTDCPETIITETFDGGATVLLVYGSGVTTLFSTNDGASTTTITPDTASITTTTVVGGVGGIIATTTVTPTTVTSEPVQATSTITSAVETDANGAYCATGWYSCGASVGGGCCPTGYSCAASCIATQSGEPGHVYKVPPNGGASLVHAGVGWLLAGCAGITGMAMILL